MSNTKHTVTLTTSELLTLRVKMEKSVMEWDLLILRDGGAAKLLTSARDREASILAKIDEAISAAN